MPEINSTAEVGVMTRQMADDYGAELAERYARQVTDKLGAIVEGFEVTGDDRPDARRLSAALATVIDGLELGELEEGIGEAVFQAGAIGIAATPVAAVTEGQRD